MAPTCLQILHRPPEMKPGDLKAMELTEDGYYMTVSPAPQALLCLSLLSYLIILDSAAVQLLLASSVWGTAGVAEHLHSAVASTCQKPAVGYCILAAC